MSSLFLKPGHCDAFDLLGIAPHFNLDQDNLEKIYHEAQKKVHPDQWSSSLIKTISGPFSSNLTQAYQKLLDPLSRAQCLFVRANAWPLPNFVDLFEEMLNAPPCGFEALCETYDRGLEALSLAFSNDNIPQAQRLFWKLSHTRKCLDMIKNP